MTDKTPNEGKPFSERICDHCKGLISIRLPVPSTGCDHLYYPDNCATCRGKLRPFDFEKLLDEKDARIKELEEAMRTSYDISLIRNKKIQYLKNDLVLAVEGLTDLVTVFRREGNGRFQKTAKAIEELLSRLTQTGEGK